MDTQKVIEALHHLMHVMVDEPESLPTEHTDSNETKRAHQLTEKEVITDAKSDTIKTESTQPDDHILNEMRSGDKETDQESIKPNNSTLDSVYETEEHTNSEQHINSKEGESYNE